MISYSEEYLLSCYYNQNAAWIVSTANNYDNKKTTVDNVSDLENVLT